MVSNSNTNKAIGILGGGQLGRMLYEACLKLGYKKVQIYDPAPQALRSPAAQIGAKITQGDLKKFLKTCDVLLLENEFISCDELEQAFQENELQGILPPRHVPLASIRIAQNKLKQKDFFKSQALPTAEYEKICEIKKSTPFLFQEIYEKILKLYHRWGGLVIKKATYGYDGKGNFSLKPSLSENELASLREPLEQFFGVGAHDSQPQVAWYAEKWIPFQFECALVATRGSDGSWGSYPLIQTVQKNGVCLLAYGPAQQQEKFYPIAQKISQQVGEQLSLIGTYAIEFFVNQEGQLLINEMAPRVHNSGHFSLNASQYSQFQNHVRALLGETIQEQDFITTPVFAMINLLGPENKSEWAVRPICFKEVPAKFHFYWYDKARIEPGRKLGHIVVSSDHVLNSYQEVQIYLDELLRLEREWVKSL